MMKFKQPRILFDLDLLKIASRAEKKQKTSSKMSDRKVLDLAKICRAIEHSVIPDAFVCKKISNQVGSGIFLHPDAKPLKKGDLIGPYSGALVLNPHNTPGDSCYVFSLITEITLNREEQKKHSPLASFRPNRLYAIDIDAENEGNFIRFINHSDKPNVYAELLQVPKNNVGLSPSPLEVFYVAKKEILPGEQLLVSYEAEDNSYWKNLDIQPTQMVPRTFMLSNDLRVLRAIN